MPRSLKCFKGFTLAELLISLAILGVIATFTIPKILTAQTSAQNIAKTKDVAAMISGALLQAKMDGVVSATSTAAVLTPYMNYVKLDTSGTVIDGTPLIASFSCVAASPCLQLHNGGYLLYTTKAFNFYAAPYNAYGGLVEFVYDSDAGNNTTATVDGPLKSVQFDLYYDDFLTTRGATRPGSGFGGGGATYDPSWFSWN